MQGGSALTVMLQALPMDDLSLDCESLDLEVPTRGFHLLTARSPNKAILDPRVAVL